MRPAPFAALSLALVAAAFFAPAASAADVAVHAGGPEDYCVSGSLRVPPSLAVDQARCEAAVRGLLPRVRPPLPRPAALH